MNSKLWVYCAVTARRARIQNPLASALLPPAPYLNNELRFNVTQLRANSHTLVIPSVLLDLWVEVCYTISVAEVVRLTEAKSRTVSLDNFSMVLCVHLSQALALRQISRFVP